MTRRLGDLPHAIDDREELDRHLAGRRPAVFLDYDGTLTPIVDRPEQAFVCCVSKKQLLGLTRDGAARATIRALREAEKGMKP